VAVGEDGKIITSADGTAWTDESEAGNSFYGIAYGNDIFVVAGQDGRIETSTDAAT